MKIKKSIRMGTDGELCRYDKFREPYPNTDKRPFYIDGSVWIFSAEENRPYINVKG